MINKRARRGTVVRLLVAGPIFLASSGVVLWHPELLVSTRSEVTHLNWAFYVVVALGTMALFALVGLPITRSSGRAYVLSGIRGAMAAGGYAASAFCTVAASPNARVLAARPRTFLGFLAVALVLGGLFIGWGLFEAVIWLSREMRQDRAGGSAGKR